MATAPGCFGTFSRWARISWTRKCTALWNTSSKWLCLIPWRPCTNTGKAPGKNSVSLARGRPTGLCHIMSSYHLFPSHSFRRYRGIILTLIQCYSSFLSSKVALSSSSESQYESQFFRWMFNIRRNIWEDQGFDSSPEQIGTHFTELPLYYRNVLRLTCNRARSIWSYDCIQ